jgi:CheY-like chemotaxis protein
VVEHTGRPDKAINVGDGHLAIGPMRAEMEEELPNASFHWLLRAALTDVTGMVLIIDNERLVREGLSELLNTAGLSTLSAADGCEGIRFFWQYQSQIDTVILDARLPDMSGADVLTTLQQFSPEVKVIVISGLNPAEVKRRFNGKRVTAFVTKPFDINALMALLSS